jgi:hypothetical protein
MKRGEIWTVAGGKDYPFTTDQTEAPLFRLPIEPNAIPEKGRELIEPPRARLCPLPGKSWACPT